MKSPPAAFLTFRFRQVGVAIVAVLCIGLACFSSDNSGQISNYEKAVMQQMLKDSTEAVRKNYYDPRCTE